MSDEKAANQEFFSWGHDTDSSDIKNPFALALLNVIPDYYFIDLVEIRRKDEFEGIVVEFQVQRPQSPAVPIEYRERIVIIFSPEENEPPLACALRKDFPDTLHQNITPWGSPKALCLFEEPYREIKPSLSPALLLKRIANWLARASVEDLHQEDQPLEPFLLCQDQIIFDQEVFAINDTPHPTIALYPLSNNAESLLLRAKIIPSDKDVDDIPYLLLPISAEPWHSRLISHLPYNLQQLADLFMGVKIDIEEKIREFILLLRGSDNWAKVKDAKLIVLLRLPKRRRPAGPVETLEWWSFLISFKLEELTKKLGLMADTAHGPGVLIGQPQSVSLDEVIVLPIRPTFSLSKSFAKELSGLGNDDPTFAVIGVGTLGSQVVLNFARQGFGAWSIIDNDHLLPHNLARHALGHIFEGQNKARSISIEINGLLNDEAAASWHSLDVLNPDHFSQLQNVFSSADVVLDFSASHSVSRALAEANFGVGILCGFLSPNGLYLVLLSEGQARNIRLDDLEMQLAATAVENEEFHDLYRRADGLITYAGSCRDTSVQLPQDIAALHAATASQFIKGNFTSIDPSIEIWKWSSTNLTLAHHKLNTYPVTIEHKNGWTFRTSQHAINRMMYYRRRRLPNETGGVLLGKIDFDRATIYVSTVLPSPPDSIEWPTVYIRGSQGLIHQVETAKELSGGDLTYVGEWHSHPEGVSSAPSDADYKALKWLKNVVWLDGLPGIIAILGDDGLPNYIV